MIWAVVALAILYVEGLHWERRRAESVEHLGGILEQFNFLHARIFQHQPEEIMRAALERETQVRRSIQWTSG